MRPRSGLALNHGITLLNAPGTIDSDYRGEVKAILDQSRRASRSRITRGMKIAQIVIARHEARRTRAKSTTLPETARGEGGFGSTGLALKRRRLTMLKLSRKTLLALEAVIDIAFNARPEPVQAKEITARQGVPQRYLEQVMQQLVRAGVLKGVRGPRGGYRLAKERRRITVGDVVRVAESLDDEENEQSEAAFRTRHAHRHAADRSRCRTK